jgi:peptide/nickel transport system permease protein
MVDYIIRRLAQTAIFVLLISLGIFSIVRLTPGDPARIMAGVNATPEAVEKIRNQMGLNKPFWIQYASWVKRALRGDLGVSTESGRPVSTEIRKRFAATVELTFAAMVFGVIIGAFAGIIAAVFRDSFSDYFSMLVAVLGLSIPVFWLGLILLYIFGLQLSLFPLGGRVPGFMDISRLTGFYTIDTLISGDFAGFLTTVKHLFLPGITLGTIPAALIARMTRSSMLEVLQEDYIHTARAKGLSENVVIFKHAFRNALLPIITVIGLNFAILLGGAILTETIFSWPGMARYIVRAVMVRDYPVIQGGVLVIAIMVACVNTIIDILYGVADPRVRFD